MRLTDSKDLAALIASTLCIVGLLVWPDFEAMFALMGITILTLSLARQRE